MQEGAQRAREREKERERERERGRESGGLAVVKEDITVPHVRGVRSE